MKHVLSLGAGVQSTVLLLLSIEKVIPKFDHVVFSDTGFEPEAVYAHLKILEKMCEDSGMIFGKVSNGNIKTQTLEYVEGKRKRAASLPLFVLNPDGAKGMTMRACTKEYKIEPVLKYQRQVILGLKPRQRAPKEIVMLNYMGITKDEIARVKDSRHKFVQNAYPFVSIGCNVLEKTWSRQDCIRWLRENYPHLKTPRSACVMCPYHNNDEWRRIRENKDDWDAAVDFDRRIRIYPRLDGECFLHSQRVPLDQVDLRTDEERGQGSLFGNWSEECDGMCGI